VKRWGIAAGLLALLVGVGVFGWFVWPTPYRYEHAQLIANTHVLVRVDRLSGEVDALYPYGWQRLSR
jgi:hypothetical protein